MTRRVAFGSVLAAAAGLCLAWAGAAAAQVISIGDDGAVTTYAGPMVHTDQGAAAIAPPLPAAPPAAAPEEVMLAIQESSARHAVPVSLVQAVAWQESRFNNGAVSAKGALGVMQLLPKTASDLGVNPSDLRGNIDGGAAYLAQQLRRFGDVRLALAAYHAGPAAVTRYGDVPPYAETQAYVRAILARLAVARPE
ncbi:MAG: lytic transglycosylase domain-containing protein [Phenylobacterium sp.]|nr:lytic transglycosylase domain-containing protein [Phenylobacterium sp.]